MRAIQMTEAGTVDVLAPAEVDVPRPGPGEILIRVAFAGLNYTDVMAREGLRMQRSAPVVYPITPGSEAAGLVVETGEGVDPAIVGRRVTAFVRGACAEYAIARAEWTWAVPDGVGLPASLAMLVQGCTAHVMLTSITHLQAGETVLVHSGAGGVGSLAIQLAKRLGAGKVVATASTQSKRELCLRLGADHAVDYRADGWADVVRRALPEGCDVILDAVGGGVSDEGPGLLAPGGRLVVYGISSKEMSPLAGSQLMAGNQSVHGFWLTSWMERHRSLPVDELLALVADGDLEVVLGPVAPLARLGTLHQDLAGRRTSGKLVVAL